MGGTAKWRFEKRILCFIPGWSWCCFAPWVFGEHGISHAFPALGLLCSRAARQLMGMDIEHAIPWNVMPNHQMTILFVDEGDGHHDIRQEYVSGTLYYKDKYIYIYIYNIYLLYILPTGWSCASLISSRNSMVKVGMKWIVTRGSAYKSKKKTPNKYLYSWGFKIITSLPIDGSKSCFELFPYSEWWLRLL